MTTIDHIVFDIGQVLIHWDPEIPYKKLIPNDEERSWFLENVCTAQWNMEQDRGRSWTDAEDILIAKHQEHETNIRAYREYWPDMIPHNIPGTFQIMQSLVEAGHDVTMLTNFHQDTFVIAKDTYPLLDLPRGVTVSGEVKLIKPDQAIYELHAREFELQPENILFFDDSTNNVEAARQAGWQAELFTSSEQMQSDLVSYGIWSQ
ncbi:MAG: HAD family phosphatase [Rhizobiaceae bacterium]